MTVIPGNTYLYELSGKRLAHFPRYPSNFNGNCLNGFSPDGKFVLTNVGDDSYLYDLTGKQQAHFQGYMTEFSRNV